MYSCSVNGDCKFLDGQEIVPVPLVAFSFAPNFDYASARISEISWLPSQFLVYFLPNFCSAVCLFAFILEIFTVKTLVKRNYFHTSHFSLLIILSVSIAHRRTLVSM